MTHPRPITQTDADRFARAYNEDVTGRQMAIDAIKAGVTPLRISERFNVPAKIVAQEMRVSEDLIVAMRKRWPSGSSSIDNAIAAAREAKLAKRAERNA